MLLTTKHFKEIEACSRRLRRKDLAFQLKFLIYSVGVSILPPSCLLCCLLRRSWWSCSGKEHWWSVAEPKEGILMVLRLYEWRKLERYVLSWSLYSSGWRQAMKASAGMYTLLGHTAWPWGSAWTVHTCFCISMIRSVFLNLLFHFPSLYDAS